MSNLDALLQAGGDRAAGTAIVGAMGQNPKVVQVPDGELQRVAAGVPRLSIAAGAQAVANIVVSEEFRPDRIILSDAALTLDVLDVSIGTKSLNVSSDPIAGACFARDAIGSHLAGYTAKPGVGFKIRFENNTAAAIDMTAGVFGPGLN